MTVALAVVLVGAVGWFAWRTVSPPGKAAAAREVEWFRDLVGGGTAGRYTFEDARYGQERDSDRWVGSQGLSFNDTTLTSDEIVAAVIEHYDGPEVLMRLWRDDGADEQYLYVADVRRDLWVRASVSRDASGSFVVEVTPCGVGDRSMGAPTDDYEEVPIPD